MNKTSLSLPESSSDAHQADLHLLRHLIYTVYAHQSHHPLDSAMTLMEENKDRFTPTLFHLLEPEERGRAFFVLDLIYNWVFQTVSAQKPYNKKRMDALASLNQTTNFIKLYSGDKKQHQHYYQRAIKEFYKKAEDIPLNQPQSRPYFQENAFIDEFIGVCVTRYEALQKADKTTSFISTVLSEIEHYEHQTQHFADVFLFVIEDDVTYALEHAKEEQAATHEPIGSLDRFVLHQVLVRCARDYFRPICAITN